MRLEQWWTRGQRVFFGWPSREWFNPCLCSSSRLGFAQGIHNHREAFSVAFRMVLVAFLTCSPLTLRSVNTRWSECPAKFLNLTSTGSRRAIQLLLQAICNKLGVFCPLLLSCWRERAVQHYIEKNYGSGFEHPCHRTHTYSHQN